jgi:putative CocE/NonD family hydrolase
MREPAVTYYTYNETPDRAWKTSKVWPLRGEKRTAFYLHEGTLAIHKPAAPENATRLRASYDSDAEAFWTTGMTFLTDPLTKDTEVTGHASAHLWISSSAPDADLIARIDDVATDGTHTYVGIEGRLRASLRAMARPPYDTLGLPWHPFTQASSQPLTPGVPVEVQLEFLPTSYIFKAGHRIRLALQFSDSRSTARLDPAPEVTLIHGPDAPSMIELPIIPRDHLTW